MSNTLKSLSISRKIIKSLIYPSIARHPQYWHRYHARYYSSDTDNIGFTSESLYHIEADRVMDLVTEKCDDLFDLTNDDFDYKTASGVLNVEFGPQIGTWVLNKQAPNQQLWLSSPLSGPNHYDYDQANTKWISSRDGHSLCCLLQNEWSSVVKTDIIFDEAF